MPCKPIIRKSISCEQWTPELNYTKETKQQQARREKAGVTVHAAWMDIQLFLGGLLSPPDLGVKYLDIAVTSPFTKACLDPAPAHKRFRENPDAHLTEYETTKHDKYKPRPDGHGRHPLVAAVFSALGRPGPELVSFLRKAAWHAACAQAGAFGAGTWDVPRRKGVANQLLREWLQRVRAILVRANHRMWMRSTGQAGHPARAELRVL